MKIYILLLLVLLVFLVVSRAVVQESCWYITYVSAGTIIAGSTACKHKYYFKPGIVEIYGHLLDRGIKPPIVITGRTRLSHSEFKKYGKLLATKQIDAESNNA